MGDSAALVSHRKDLQVVPTDFGCRVHAAEFDDLVFCNPQRIRFSDASTSFEGTAGLIRHKQAGIEFAMFHGTEIGVSGVTFSTHDTDLGISASLIKGQPPRGWYYAPHASSVAITLPSTSSGERFYIDGEPQGESSPSSALVVPLKAGRHQWELTATVPIPIAPEIVRTENRAGGARVVISPVAAATSYRVELSKDNGATWSTISVQDDPGIEVSGLANAEKVHIRAVALNAMHESSPGLEYPLYVTSDPPPPPDGLRAELSDGFATLTWGEVLGITEYRLYARVAGASDFHLLHRGRDRFYHDQREGIQAAAVVPGKNGAAGAERIEYCVTAVNGNGEGARSRIVDTNPASWRNWNPRPGEAFRRVYSFPSDSRLFSDVSPQYYPR